MKTDKYYESLIKCDVLNALRRRKIIDSKSVIASEYVLGSTGRRVDLAIYNGSRLIGIEIKSKHDSLTRLKDQLSIYVSCFDETILVLDEKHLRSATDIASNQVSIFCSQMPGSMEIFREATIQAKRAKSTCLQLLNVSELKKLVGAPASSPAKKRALLTVANQMSDEQVFDAATASFIQAFSDTSKRFWRRVGRRNITMDAMLYLSRFASERLNLQAKRQQQEIFWETWKQNAAASFQNVSN